MSSFKNRFSNLGHPNRIWTISAIHGQLERLYSIHDALFDKCRPGDRIVYTGNYLGGAFANPKATLDELLAFRRRLLAQPGMVPDDFVYLRGRQEELWSKILQLQFAPSARDVLTWMAQHHPEMESILEAYGSSFDHAQTIARGGVINLTKWTGFLKEQIRRHSGHETFFTVLRRAAFTEHRSTNDNNILFVHAGLDPALPLMEQGDHFWWSSRGFNHMDAAYSPFRTVIRGHDPEHAGVHIGSVSISLDGGCGHGGKLVCAQMSDRGYVLELLSA